MKSITVYSLIQKLSKFKSNNRVIIKNNHLYITIPDTEAEDIERYEEWINSIENSNFIY